MTTGRLCGSSLAWTFFELRGQVTAAFVDTGEDSVAWLVKSAEAR